MMKNSVIDEMMNGMVYSAGTCIPKTEEYEVARDKVIELKKKVLDKLDEDVEKDFEDYMEMYMRVVSMEVDEAFRQGVSVGARFIAEAFLIGENE